MNRSDEKNITKSAQLKSISNATTAFGVVQLLTSLIGIAREKIMAIFLGPVGVGIHGILFSYINLLGTVFSLGLPTSSIKNISEKHGDDERVVLTLRTILTISAILGTLMSVLLSGYFSRILSQNDSEFSQIIILTISIAIFFYVIESGELAILQARRQIKVLAKIRVTGSVAALLLVIPIYVLFGLDGISYALVGLYFCQFLSLIYFSLALKHFKISFNPRVLYGDSKEMLSSGFLIMISAVFLSLVNFITKTYISTNAGVEVNGYFEAGNKVINGYVGLLFVVMAKDFFPRAASLNHNEEKLNGLLNDQLYISWLILLPILLAVQLYSDNILEFFYTSQFVETSNFIKIATLGIVFKMIGWALSYIVLAKGDSKVFFTYEVVGAGTSLLLNIWMFNSMGLTGLGVSFTLYNLLFCLTLIIICHNNYDIAVNYRNISKAFGILLLISVLYYLDKNYEIINPMKILLLMGFSFLSGLTFYNRIIK